MRTYQRARGVDARGADRRVIEPLGLGKSPKAALGFHRVGVEYGSGQLEISCACARSK